MSVPPIDLLQESTKAGKQDVYKTLVAVFKEEPENPRVLADSDQYLAYTLKNGRTLRLIQRSNNVKGSLRAHAKPIHAIQFVNYRSNVAASAAEQEFFVWVVTNENAPDADPASSTLTVKLYFKLQDTVTVGNFAFFINSHVGIFDVLVLYGKKAAVLESSKLVPKYEKEPLDASLATDSRELRELSAEATTKSLCCINNSGWFAFTMEPTMCAACTMRNRSTPAWACCKGARILSLELLDLKTPDDPALLMACSDDTVFQWALTGESEPTLLRTYTMGGAITTMLSSKNTFVLFNAKRQVALVEARGRDGFSSTLYEIDTTVRPRSVCFNRKPYYGCVLVDAQSQVEMHQLTLPREREAAAHGGAGDAEVKPSPLSSPTAAAHGARAAAGTPSRAAPVESASPAMDPAILSVSRELPPPPGQGAAKSSDSKAGASAHLSNLMQQIQRGNLRTSTSPVPAATAPPAAAEGSGSVSTENHSSAASQAARAMLYSSALPQGTDGPLASAVHDSDESVRRELESLQSISRNVSHILQLTPDQVARDHEQLVTLALEAQMTELQQANVSVGAASPASVAPSASGARDPTAEAFNTYAIVKLLAPVAHDIASGVTHGIRDTLRTDLDSAIRDALGSSVREGQKRALKRRLDEALSESTTHFSNEVRQRLSDFASRDLKDVFSQVNSSLTALVEENRRLQASLNDIIRSGALEQMQAAQRELAELKETIRRGGYAAVGGADGAGAASGANPSSFHDARPNPETILTTARTLLVKEQRPREALEYMLLAKQPALTLQLLRQLGGDASTALVANPSVPDGVWSDTLTQLCVPSALENSTDEEADAVFVAELLFELICEREALTATKSAKSQQLLSSIRHFLAKQKSAVSSKEGQKVMRDLEKSIQ